MPVFKKARRTLQGTIGHSNLGEIKHVSGESKKVLGKLESVQRSAVQGSGSPDQRGSAKGAGLGDKETRTPM